MVVPRKPLFLLMWEEDWWRIRNANEVKMLDMSEGRGPLDKHRLLLAESPGKTSISDPQGLKSGDSVGAGSDRLRSSQPDTLHHRRNARLPVPKGSACLTVKIGAFNGISLGSISPYL
jgi:hypothetical protein